MHIADVAPLRRMPHTIEVLSYLIPEELEPRIRRGSLVEVGIRGTAIPALVIRTHHADSSPHTLQPVRRPLDITLPASTMSVIESSAAYFAVSLPYFVDALIPTPPKRWKELAERPDHPSSPFAGERRLLEPGRPEDAIPSVVKCIRETCDHGMSVHVVVPNHERALELEEELGTALRIGVASSEVAAGKLFTVFANALRGTLDVLITTRRGILFPLSRKGRIIVMDEESSDHKQWDMKPRYDARTIARFLADAEGCGLVMESLTPRLVTRAACANTSETHTAPDIVIHTNTDPKHPLSQPTLDAIEAAEDEGCSHLILDFKQLQPDDVERVKGADLVVALFPDRFLAADEWTAEERLYNRMLGLVKRMKPTATLIIVAMSPHRVFAGLLPARRDEYLAKLLAERQEFGYPPTGALVKLIVQSDASMQDALQKADRLADTLTSDGVEFLGPYPSIPPSVRGRHRALAILKGSKDDLMRLRPILKALHDDILIDIDPERIFR